MAFVDGPTKTFTAGAALSQYRLVRISSSKLAYNSATDSDILGVLRDASFADGDERAVMLFSKQGTLPMVASEAISAYAKCYAAASGKIAATGTVYIGIAMEASGADGDQIEVLPNVAVGARSQLAEDALQPYPIPVYSLRVWDAPQTNAVGTAAADDLAVTYNTFGTAAPSVETGDIKTTSSTRKVGFQVVVPPEYVAGQSITAVLKAGMKTTVSDTSCTIDLEVFRAAAPTVDICATAAQSINSLTAAEKSFTITPTNVVAGDVLDCVVSIIYVDAATGTAVIGKWYVGESSIKMDIKG